MRGLGKGSCRRLGGGGGVWSWPGRAWTEEIPNESTPREGAQGVISVCGPRPLVTALRLRLRFGCIEAELAALSRSKPGKVCWCGGPPGANSLVDCPSREQSDTIYDACAGHRACRCPTERALP